MPYESFIFTGFSLLDDNLLLVFWNSIARTQTFGWGGAKISKSCVGPKFIVPPNRIIEYFLMKMYLCEYVFEEISRFFWADFCQV